MKAAGFPIGNSNRKTTQDLGAEGKKLSYFPDALNST